MLREVLGFIVEHKGDAFWCHQHSGMSSTAIKNYSLNISLRRRPEVVQFVQVLADLEGWLRSERAQMSKHNPVAKPSTTYSRRATGLPSPGF